jgi:uncharacterized membrane protein YbhN (UPF0104 family)
MSFSTALRRLLPVAVSIAIIVAAASILGRTLHRINPAEVWAQLKRIPAPALAMGALLVVTVYAVLALYEVIIVRQVRAPVSAFRAVLAALVAVPIGHAVGLGALSGGAVRYRIYSAAGVRAIDIGKLVVLSAMPYAAGLGLLLGLALVLYAGRAGELLHVAEPLARSAGLALLALHLGYVTLTLRRRGPIRFGSMVVTLPSPRLTAIQYALGAAEVCAASGVLYVFLPHGHHALPYVVFVAAYVLSILAGLASSVPAGLGVFESVLLLLLPRVPPAQLIGSVLAYRFLLEVLPLIVALLLFTGFECGSRLGNRSPGGP